MPEGLIWAGGTGCVAYTLFELVCLLSTPRPDKVRAWDENGRELHVEEIK